MGLLDAAAGLAGGLIGGPAGAAAGQAIGQMVGGAAGGQEQAQFEQALGGAALSFAQDMLGEMQEAFADTDEEE